MSVQGTYYPPPHQFSIFSCSFWEISHWLFHPLCVCIPHYYTSFCGNFSLVLSEMSNIFFLARNKNLDTG